MATSETTIRTARNTPEIKAYMDTVHPVCWMVRLLLPPLQISFLPLDGRISFTTFLHAWPSFFLTHLFTVPNHCISHAEKSFATILRCGLRTMGFSLVSLVSYSPLGKYPPLLPSSLSINHPLLVVCLTLFFLFHHSTPPPSLFINEDERSEPRPVSQKVSAAIITDVIPGHQPLDPKSAGFYVGLFRDPRIRILSAFNYHRHALVLQT